VTDIVNTPKPLNLALYALFVITIVERILPTGRKLSKAKYNISYIYGTLKIYGYVQKKVKR
jgi:hypothetical protein